MQSQRRRSDLPFLAAVLSLAWIATILPAVRVVAFGRSWPVPDFFGPVVDWRHLFLRWAGLLGSGGAWLGAMAWAWCVGAFDPKLGLWKPWKVESWILDALRFGGTFGSLVAAVLPTWAIWWGSRVASRPEPPPRTPPSLAAALRAAWTTALSRPSAWLLLAAFTVVMAHAGDRLAWWLGRPAGLPSAGRLLADAALAAVVGLASVRAALAAVDGREFEAGDLLVSPVRMLAYGVTSGVVALGVLVGVLLSVVPGVLVGMTFGFAPFVVADEGGSPARALARSAALTRGVRWRLLRIGLVLVGLHAGAVGALARGGASPALMLIDEAVLVPLSMLASVHLYRQLAASLPARGAPAATRFGWRRDPALAVAAAWSIALGVPFGWSVVQRIQHPDPSWIMLPPVRNERPDLTAPVSGWCPYSRHASASGCQWTLARIGKRGSFGRYTFDAAGCFPAEQIRSVTPHDFIVWHLDGVLRRAVGSSGVVERSWRIGRDTFDYVVFARDADGAAFPVVVLDVGGPDLEGLDQQRVARLAAAGIPEYWLVSEPHVDTPAEVTMWSDPDRQARAYRRSFGVSGGGNLPDGKPIRLGPTRLEANDFVPPTCPPGPEAVSSPASRPECDGSLAFVLDGTSPPPTVALAASGAVSFTGVSSAPPGFDPRRFALHVRMREIGYPGTEVLDATVPGGGPWRPAGQGRGWVYAGPASDGFTHLAIAPTDGDRLAWKIEARERGEPIAPRSVLDSPSVRVRITLDGAPGDPTPCGTVFLPVRSVSDGCRFDETMAAVRCTISPAMPECARSDLEGLVRCTVEEAARGQDVYFAGHGAYFSGACGGLPGVPERPAISCVTQGVVTTFIVTAIHAGAQTACTLDLGKGPLIDCPEPAQASAGR